MKNEGSSFLAIVPKKGIMGYLGRGRGQKILQDLQRKLDLERLSFKIIQGCFGMVSLHNLTSSYSIMIFQRSYTFLISRSFKNHANMNLIRSFGIIQIIT